MMELLHVAIEAFHTDPDTGQVDPTARLVPGILDDNIAAQISTLLTPTTRAGHWGRTNPLSYRADHANAVLGAAGWFVEPGDPHDPLCNANRVTDELGIVATSARRWMRDATIPSVVAPDANGVPGRYSRLSDVWAQRDRLAGVIHLTDLTEELGVRYDEIYRLMRHLGLAPAQQGAHPHRRRGRGAASRARPGPCTPPSFVKLPIASRQLKVSFTTVRLLVANGDLALDPETDTSGAGFVTRTSVRTCCLARNEAKHPKARSVATVPSPKVVRFTGLGRRAIVDLVRQGLLEDLPGRRPTCEITTTSLDAWLASRWILTD